MTAVFKEALQPYSAAITLFRNYVQKTRGFRSRERERFHDFIDELVGRNNHDRDSFVEFALAHRRWDTYLDPIEFNAAIPPEQLQICRRNALRIAGGSGRRPISADSLDLIDRLFPRQMLGG